jgi:hypothetical protein
MEKLCAASQNSDGFGSYPRRRSGIKDGPAADVTRMFQILPTYQTNKYRLGRSSSRHNDAREHIEQQQPSSDRANCNTGDPNGHPATESSGQVVNFAIRSGNKTGTVTLKLSTSVAMGRPDDPSQPSP